MTAPTLPEFILARIAEDEVRATMREWHESGCDWFPDPQGYTYPCDCGVPERLRAQCAAYRGVIEAAWRDAEDMEGEFGRGRSREQMEADGLYPIALEHLATIWADHADFDERWRP